MIEFDIGINEDIELELGNTQNNIFIEDEMALSPETDHRKLTHRDAEGQHPIEAIDNLREELEELETDPLSSVEIDEIFKMAVI